MKKIFSKEIFLLPLFLLLTLFVSVNKVNADTSSVYVSDFYSNINIYSSLDSSIVSNLTTYYVNNFQSTYNYYFILQQKNQVFKTIFCFNLKTISISCSFFARYFFFRPKNAIFIKKSSNLRQKIEIFYKNACIFRKNIIKYCQRRKEKTVWIFNSNLFRADFSGTIEKRKFYATRNYTITIRTSCIIVLKALEIILRKAKFIP